MQDLADPKISPDGKFVGFIRKSQSLGREHRRDGKEHALTLGGHPRTFAKGELDWVYP